MVNAVRTNTVYNFRIPPKKLENNPVKAIEAVSEKLKNTLADVTSAGYNANGFAVVIDLSKQGLNNVQFEKYFGGLIENNVPAREIRSVYNFNEDKLIFHVNQA